MALRPGQLSLREDDTHSGTLLRQTPFGRIFPWDKMILKHSVLFTLLVCEFFCDKFLLRRKGSVEVLRAAFSSEGVSTKQKYCYKKIV